MFNYLLSEMCANPLLWLEWDRVTCAPPPVLAEQKRRGKKLPNSGDRQ